MANSRLIQMYGFAEADNPHDDVHITKETITETITALGVDAHEAKIKLLDSLGFFDEGFLKNFRKKYDKTFKKSWKRFHKICDYTNVNAHARTYF